MFFTAKTALQAVGSRRPRHDITWLKAQPILCTHAQVDSLYIASAHFMPHHMDSIAAFRGLKVLHMDRATMAGAMDSATFSVLGQLTELEELMLAPQLTGVDDEGFMLGFGPLHRLRHLELCGVERVSTVGNCFCVCLSI